MLEYLRNEMGDDLLMDSILKAEMINSRIELKNNIDESEIGYYISCLVFGHPDISIEVLDAATDDEIHRLKLYKMIDKNSIEDGFDIEKRKERLKATKHLF